MKEEDRILDEEEEEEVTLIVEEEWDRRDAHEAPVEEPVLLNEWPNWDLKTHDIVWDIEHGYV